MPDVTRDDGPTATQLWGSAWVMALLAAGVFIKLLFEGLDGDTENAGQMAPWLFLGIAAAVFTAACAVIGAVKGAESRIRAEVQYLTQREVNDS